MSNQDVGEEKVITSSLQNQIIACLIANLSSLAFGGAIGWLSPQLNELTSDGTPLDGIMTPSDIALAGGLLCLGGLAGLPIFTVVASSRGRKAASYCVGVPLVAGFLLKLCTSSIFLMLVGRFLCGIGGGGCMSLPALLVGECCEARIRGLLAGLLPVMYALGVLMAYILGPILSYREFTAVLMVVPLVFQLGFWFVPETPVYRLKMGLEEEAARSIAWYRKLPLNGGGVRTELVRISRQLRGAEPLDPDYEPTKEALAHELEWLQQKKPENQQKMLSKPTDGTSAPDRPSSWKLLLLTRSSRKGLFMCLFMVLMQSLMGLFAVASYATPIFTAAGTGLTPDSCSLIYAGILVLGSSSGSLLIDRAGRRPLQIISSIVVFLGEATLGWCFQVGTAPGWLAILSLTLSVYAFNVGCGIMHFVYVSEVFPNEVRDLATGIVMGAIWLTGYLLLQIFPLAVDAFGIHMVFYFFSCVALFNAVISWLILPETKGLSQEEVIRQLSGYKPTVKIVETPTNKTSAALIV